MSTRTGNIYVDSLITGYELTNLTLLYYLDDAGSSAWTAQEKNAFEAATQTWEVVADINFARTFSFAQAHLSESKYTADALDQGEHFQYLGSTSTELTPIFIYSNYDYLEGGFNQNGLGWDGSTGPSRGTDGFATIVHELGHAIGLDHTHSDSSSDVTSFPGVDDPFLDGGPNGLNAQLFSIMSYREGPELETDNYSYGRIGGPMAFDIAAVQAIYGANLNTKTGDDVYILPAYVGGGTFFSSIWDAGGTDSIVHNGAQDASIDLREATLLNEPGGGGFLSRADGIFGGFTIANGVTIENATSGSGSDFIVGNNVANVLSGRDGDDTIGGGDGADVLYGDNGNDWLWGGADADTLGGGDGDDTLNGQSGDDWIYGNEGSDTLNGGDGNDVLFAGGSGYSSLGGDDGNDTLISGYHSDWMWGGAGADKFKLDWWSWHDFIQDFKVLEDQIDLSSSEWSYSSASQLSIVDDAAGDAFISLGQNTWISVAGVSANSLTDDHFIF